MHPRHRLLRLLADGRFHSGEQLGDALGVGRTAVWKHVRALEASGLEVHAVRGRGYRLADPPELLQRERILSALDPSARALLARLEVLPEVDSTNRYLLADAGAPCGAACLAEFQSAGRGRRGRAWRSPFGANVYLSVLWSYRSAPAALQGLSLALGVAAAEAVAALGVPDVGLKWPNDLVWRGRKLGGILIEMSAEAGGPARVVAGIGLNVRMPGRAGLDIDQPWTDLAHAAREVPARNLVAAALLASSVSALERFAREGFTPFRAPWARRDAVRDRPVELHTPGGLLRGRACGVDETGALLVSAEGKLTRVASGEISLRVAT